MDYLQPLQYHYRPKKGWINDPNGLVYFDGYYHVFYQHAPDYEIPWQQHMHWGHARTKDFLNWEELPIALTPDTDYDGGGCWSGTAIVKDGTLYLFYASIQKESRAQMMSVAYSKDGIHFEKYAGNPVLTGAPADGSHNFRDPAVAYINGSYYCVMASSHDATGTGRLLLYRSADLLHWDYVGVMSEWANCMDTECPSFMSAGELCLLATSVRPKDANHYFTLMFGDFENDVFKQKYAAEVDKGPDQYAGQIFKDHLGRCLLISWAPGWKYKGYAAKDVGCMSVPREIKLENGRITAYPVEEVRHLLTDSDPALRRTESGFVIERTGREPVVYEGEIRDLKILRDGYIIEVYVNGGEEVYTALL